jgi:PAS domain S-box-containing protein
VPKRLLLALRDETLARHLAKRVFEPAGYGVTQVSTAGELHKALANRKLDLLFLGDGFEDIESLEFAEDLKRTHPTLPVVFLAKKASREALMRSIQLGFVDYLTLPVSKSVALDAARRGLERKQRWDGWLRRETGRITGPLERRLSELESILEQVNDGVMLLDTESRILMVNPAMRQTFGLDSKNLQGKSVDEVFHNKELLRLMEEGNEDTSHMELQSPDGKTYDLRFSRIDEIGTVVSLHDISSLKQLDSLRKDFVNTVSHDLRSPLTAILGYVELIERAGPVTPQQSEFIKRVKSSVHTTTDLIDDLLNLGRVEVGLIDEMTPVDLKLVIAQALETQQSAIQNKHQTLKFADSGALSPVLGSRTQLGQVVNNLIGNASKYTQAGGEIVVRVREEQNQIILHVADNGPGIPVEEQSKIFEKFYRASNMAGKEQGTGLGLAIVKTIVENHRGRIWVDSKVGEGSIFTVVLPVAKQASA